MADSTPSIPSTISPQRVRQLILRLSHDDQFRKHFKDAAREYHGYRNIRTIDPYFPGPFQNYVLAIQYLIHDPRLHDLYEQNYQYLNDPDRLEHVCIELAKKHEIMGNLEKGILYEPEDEKALAQVEQEPLTEEKQHKIEEVLDKAVKKKETKKHTEKKAATEDEVQVKKTEPEDHTEPKVDEEPAQAEKPVVTQSAPENVASVQEPKAALPIPSPQATKPINPLSFRLKKVVAAIAPSVQTAVKRVSTASFVFYKRHPITAKAAIGAAIGGVASTLMGLPANPVSGIIAGAFAPTIIGKAVQAISPPPRPEPSYFGEEAEFEDTEMNEWANSLPSGSVGFEPNYMGISQPEPSPRPRQNMLGRVNSARNALRLARNLRTGLTAARAAALFANPVGITVLIVLGVLLLIILLFFLLFVILPTNSFFPPGQPDFNPAAGGQAPYRVTVKKTAPDHVENGEIIPYEITVTYTGNGQSADIEVTDPIPTNTEVVNPGSATTRDGKLIWLFKGMTRNQPEKMAFAVKPTVSDVRITNTVTAKIISEIGRSGGGGALLPNPLPAPAANWESKKATIMAVVRSSELTTYQKAGEITGTPWQVLIGLHYVETGGSLSSGTSLVSGRKIGVVEPDVPRSACAAGETGPGKPVPMDGGCGFNSFLDSAIYAGYHIQSKIGKVPQSMEDAVAALSRYNGGGNANCDEGLPYQVNCPPKYPGEDDPYAMADFDEVHSSQNMYIIYCADFTRCSPLRPFARPGAYGVIRAITEEGL